MEKEKRNFLSRSKGRQRVNQNLKLYNTLPLPAFCQSSQQPSLYSHHYYPGGIKEELSIPKVSSQILKGNFALPSVFRVE